MNTNGYKYPYYNGIQKKKVRANDFNSTLI